MLQDDYRSKYKQICKSWNDSVSIYKELVRANIKKDMTVLEAGCGFSSMFKEEYKKAGRVIGVDVCEEFLKMNEVLNEKILASLEDIPQIESESINLIISSWVFEHIQDPDKAFAEFARVLKKGGKLIFLTPNDWNYIVLLNRIVPDFLRKRIVGAMSENLVTDPMPAVYRANSVGKLRQLAEGNNLKIEKLVLNGDPTYVAINKLFFYAGVLIESLLSLPVLQKMRVHIIAVLVK
ncbi:MAG: class I SAM-dependent methyltransferase [Candidatus Dojkabacteria bacterium]|jgi:ubiquinone/menaquinone biosynthesis C-methylase UbiE|nr:class I SAM-dependent methyltransferase [Candidatus Dojkabacteria bacterium]